MAVRGNKRRQAVDRGFVLSDHSDWKGLLQAIRLSGAEHIYPTHGFVDAFTKYLLECGYKASPVKTGFSSSDIGDQ